MSPTIQSILSRSKPTLTTFTPLIHRSISSRTVSYPKRPSNLIDSRLPTSFRFYPNHKSYPPVQLPPYADMYTNPASPPFVPGSSVFHYLFPPKRKGQHHHYYPAPDARTIAFIDGLTGRELYRNELAVQAMWLSSGLSAMGLRKGQVACIFGQNSLEWVEACISAQGLNLIVSPINYAYTPEEVLHQLKDSTAQVVFVQPDLLPVLEKAIALEPGIIPQSRIILLCPFADKPKDLPYPCVQEVYSKQRVPRQLVDIEDKETAYLCYSSGTTGKAKGVETSHHNITSQIQAVNIAYEPLGPNDRVLGVLPFGHIYGLTLLCHQPLTRGSTVVVLPKFDVETVFKTIQDYRITWALVVPPMLIAMLNSPFWDKYDLSSLRGVQTGAAPCSNELMMAFEQKFPLVQPDKFTNYTRRSCIVTQGYGLTETSPVTHVMNLTEATKRHGKIGKVIPLMQARVVDAETEKDVPQGERGELWVRGASVMKGYWKNEEATRNTFAPGGWFKTGDVAVVDEEGYFSIVDRVKELIKYKGYQVPPAELEALLLTHPQVADVGVIGTYSESQATELPRAYIVPKGGLDSLPEKDRSEYISDIEQWVASKVANHKRLRGGIKIVDMIPKSPSGKILRKILREEAKKEQENEVKKTREAKL